jgi:hypothetical protein
MLALPVAAVAQQAASPEERMATLVNQARIAQGLNPVALSSELTAAAVAHTRDMIAKGYMEHEGRDGSTPHERAFRHGYKAPLGSAWIVVEVISARATAEAALNWLLSDRLHRGVMLRSTWREMGISYQQGGPYGQLWTIEFGCRPNVIPVIADTTSGGGVTLRFTNEECSPHGGPSQIGRATQVMVSDKRDFNGAAWEPFVSTKSVKGSPGEVFVRLRDERGREVTTAAGATSKGLTAASATTPEPIPTATPKGTDKKKSDDSDSKTSGSRSESGGGSDDRSVFDVKPPGLLAPTATPRPR